MACQEKDIDTMKMHMTAPRPLFDRFEERIGIELRGVEMRVNSAASTCLSALSSGVEGAQISFESGACRLLGFTGEP